MSSLLVIAFTDEGGADRMVADIQSLQEQQLITISDAASVIRRPDGKIKIKPANILMGPGALGGAFWGMLIGVLFYMPWLGIAVGAVTAALTAKLTHYGLSDRFVKEVGVTIRPGHSALFLIVACTAEDKLIETLSRRKATLLRADLSDEDEINLRQAFGAADE